MIRIERNALYTRDHLATLLEGSGVDVDTFIKRIAARKVFRKLWLGSDILKAYRAAPSLGDMSPTPQQPLARKPRKASVPAASGGEIDAYLRQLKSDVK